MATQYTSLLGLALPVTGELSGSWGDTVNDAITSLLDTAVAGTTSITTDADITLTTTTGVANQARQAIILWNPASGTTTRNITAPAQSKIYTVINASGGTQSIVFRGAGPTTGVTIVKGESAVVAWNGSDFIKVSNTGGSASFTNVTVSGTTTLSGLTASTALALDASKNVVSVTNTGTGNNVLSASPTLTGTVAAASLSLSSLTATRVPFAGVAGLLSDSDNMTFNGTRLTVADLADSGLTSGRVVYATTGGALVDSANLLYSGTDLTVYGLTVGRGAGAVSTNTAVGASALAANTTGTSHTAVGFNTLLLNTTGTDNTAVGREALRSNTTASGGTAVGGYALYGNTTGANNTALGINTLFTNTTGANNTALGYGSLQLNTTASNNTAVGYQAGYSNTTGTNNTALGIGALYSNGTTSGNTALGASSLAFTTSGTNNTAVGYNAGNLLTTGSKNTILGAYNGNQGGLDIRTSNNNIVLSDGDGNPRQYWNGTVWTFGAARRAVIGDQFVGDNASAGNNRGVVFGSVGLLPGDGSGNPSDNSYELGSSLYRWSIARVVGVNFPATQVASSDANTLDDYEEGTFTPTVSFGGGSTGITYSYQNGVYTKIGNVVYVRVGFVFTNKGSSTGFVLVSGFPFAAYSLSYADAVGPCSFGGMQSLTSPLNMVMDNGQAQGRIRQYSSTNESTLTNAEFTNSSYVYAAFSYNVA